MLILTSSHTILPEICIQHICILNFQYGNALGGCIPLTSVNLCQEILRKVHFYYRNLNSDPAKNSLMSSGLGKLSKGCGKSSQGKMDFVPPSLGREAKANTSTNLVEASSAEGEGLKHAPILEAIKDLKGDFSNRVLAAIEGMRTQVGECKSRDAHL